jgi:hypothetical protein
VVAGRRRDAPPVRRSVVRRSVVCVRCWTCASTEALRRALVRDAELLGGAEAVRQRYRHRYLPGQRLYRRQCDPVALADVVIDSTGGG